MGASYNEDFCAWAEQQAELLRNGQIALLDSDRLAAEIEGLGQRERMAVVGRLGVLLALLLKWRSIGEHPERKSWRASINSERRALGRLLAGNASLKIALGPLLEDAYRDALDLAVVQTPLDYEDLPADCPWSAEEVLGDFLPEPPRPPVRDHRTRAGNRSAAPPPEETAQVRIERDGDDRRAPRAWAGFSLLPWAAALLNGQRAADADEDDLDWDPRIPEQCGAAYSEEIVDLGGLPARIRALAGFWGGCTSDARTLYELAKSDGLVRDLDRLRFEIASVHDHGARAELAAWLASRSA